ncbi:hypothetical protein BH20CHL4_BH20CHL4_08500 [soil metagenome]
MIVAAVPCARALSRRSTTGGEHAECVETVDYGQRAIHRRGGTMATSSYRL